MQGSGLHETRLEGYEKDIEGYQSALNSYIQFIFNHTNGQLGPGDGENGVTPRVVFKSAMATAADAEHHGCHDPPSADERVFAFNAVVAWLNFVAQRTSQQHGISFHDVARMSKLDEVTGLKGDGLHCDGRPTCSFQALALLHHAVLTLGE